MLRLYCRRSLKNQDACDKKPNVESSLKDDEAGLNVCLHCFNGGCVGDRNHALLHFQRYGHALALNIRRTPKQVQVSNCAPSNPPVRVSEWQVLIQNSLIKRDEPPPKMSKLAIAAETDEDRYNVETSVVCYACPLDNVDKSTAKLSTVIDGVMNAMSFTKREEVKAWEQEFVPCEHTLCLVQADAGDLGSKGTVHIILSNSAKTDRCNLSRHQPVLGMRFEGKPVDLPGVW